MSRIVYKEEIKHFSPEEVQTVSKNKKSWWNISYVKNIPDYEALKKLRDYLGEQIFKNEFKSMYCSSVFKYVEEDLGCVDTCRITLCCDLEEITVIKDYLTTLGYKTADISQCEFSKGKNSRK